jgi:hypothetical protein
MNKVLRSVGLAAMLASGTVLGGSAPASAAGGVGFVGSAHVDCFGCGTSNCDASLTIHGVKAKADTNPPEAEVIVGGGGSTTICVAAEPADVTCLITGSASGRVEGSVNVDFNWTRVGATALITTSGDINGAGTAAFHVSSPTGNPCGQEVFADIAGALAGS